MKERGSAVVETVMAMVILMVLALGAIEVAFALYARNVVAAAAHEGARAAVELGSGARDATSVARAAADRAAGGLLDDLRVTTTVREAGSSALVRVRVRGRLDAFGPVPFPMTLTSTATVTRATRVR